MFFAVKTDNEMYIYNQLMISTMSTMVLICSMIDERYISQALKLLNLSIDLICRTLIGNLSYIMNLSLSKWKYTVIGLHLADDQGWVALDINKCHKIIQSYSHGFFYIIN